MPSSQTVFYSLSALAFPILLGGLLINGTLNAMYRAWSSGEFSAGIPCHHVYFGIPILDHYEAIPVTFWYPIVREGVTRLQAVMLCASLQTAGLWAAIESLREGNKHWIFRYAPIYCFLWGGLGVATLLPVYFHIELVQRSTNASPRLSMSKARALLPALIIGLFYPYYLVLYPPSGTTASQHQSFIAFYQLSPFFVYIAIQTMSCLLPAPMDSPMDTSDGVGKDASFAKTSYAVSGVWAAIAYVSTVIIALTSSDPEISLGNIFIPSISDVGNATAATHIKEGSFLFMKIDYIMVLIACVFYAAKTLELMWVGGPERAKGIASHRLAVVGFCLTFVGSLIVGPGAVVSAVLYTREDKLRIWESEEKDRGINPVVSEVDNKSVN